MWSSVANNQTILTHTPNCELCANKSLNTSIDTAFEKNTEKKQLNSLLFDSVVQAIDIAR